MKRVLILISFITAIVGCNKDRETDDLQWKFSVETDNRDIQLGLDVGQEVPLKYVLKKEYSEGANITYQIVTSKSNFSISDEKGKSIELNKKYTLESDTLKLKYQGLEKGEQKLKVIFKNTKGYQVDKELSFNFDDFGFGFKQLENEVHIGNYLELNYILSFYKNKTAFYSIKILKNEPQGHFLLSKGGGVVAKNVGDEFEIFNTNDEKKNLIEGTLYYYTETPTKGSRKDEILLEVQAKDSSEKKRISVRVKFLKPNFSVNVEKLEGNNLEYNIKINDIKKENNIYSFQDVNFTNVKKEGIKILYNERMYDITKPINFEGIGDHKIKIILPEDFDTAKSNFSFKIGYLNGKFVSENKIIEVDFRDVWQYPKFIFRSNYKKTESSWDNSLDKILVTLQLDEVKASQGTDLNDYKMKINFKSDLSGLDDNTIKSWHLDRASLTTNNEVIFYHITGSPFTVYSYWIYYSFIFDVEIYYKEKRIYYKKNIRAQDFSNKEFQIRSNDFIKV